MSSAALSAAVRSCLPSASRDLDEPSLDFLCAIIAEEVDFLHEVPGSLTRVQLAHVLAMKLHEQMIDFEIARDSDEAGRVCMDIVKKMQSENIVQLNPGDEEVDASPSAPSASSSEVLPRLSAPIRLSDLAQSEAEKTAALEVSMAALYKASVRWSPDEEVNLFQSLADIAARGGDSEESGGEEEEEELEGGCEMCRRPMPLTKHHLIPRATHKMRVYAELNDDERNRCILICRPCHSALHRMEDEKSLAAHFSTLEKILEDERMQRWVKYISKRRVNRTEADNKTGTALHYGR